jgi:hypothetical protein
MYLVTSDMGLEQRQTFTLTTPSRKHISRASLWVYLNDLSDAAVVQFSIKNPIGQIVWSTTRTGLQIKTFIGGISTYSHGKYFLDVDTDLLLGLGEHVFRAEQISGHSSTQYISWCKDWESTYYAPIPASGGDYEDPFYLRLYDHKGREVS